MDPLSITASTITLIEAATKIYRFLSEISEAGAKFTELCTELNHLTDVLQSINAVRRDAQKNVLAFAPVEQDLWTQSEIAFSDCEKTLDDLASLIEKIKPTKTTTTVLRRLRLATYLHLQAKDLASFREKLHTSNSSFQTLLQVLNVSLSIRSNKSQQDIFIQLKKLKRVIEASQCATAEPNNSLINNASHQSLLNNQRELVRAAQSFYSSASSTASTGDGTVNGSQETHSKRLSTRVAAWSVAESDLGSLASQTRRRVEDYITNYRHSTAITSRSGFYSRPGSYSQVSHHAANITFREPVRNVGAPPQRLADLSIDDVAVDELSSKSEFDPDSFLYDCLRQLADDSIQSHDIAKAEIVLRQALRQGKSLAQGDPRQVRMRIQLVLVEFLQGKGRDMEASVLDLVKFHVSKAVADQLLYILVLAHVLEKDHDSSKRLLPELLRGPDSSGSIVSPTNIETMQLWATSCRLAGDYLEAEAIEARFPMLKEKALPTVSGFILQSEELLLELIGPDQGLYIPFKREIVTAEKERLRHGPRTLFNIRWLQERPNKTAKDKQSTPIDGDTDEDTNEDGASISEDSMKSCDVSEASRPKKPQTSPSRWWRNAKSAGRSLKDIRKIFMRFEDNLETAQRESHQSEQERKSSPLPILLWVNESDKIILPPSTWPKVVTHEKFIVSPPINNPDYVSTPLSRENIIGNQTARPLSFVGEPGTPCFGTTESADTILAELADTGRMPADITKKPTSYSEGHTETPTQTDNPPPDVLPPSARVHAPKSGHGKVLHTLVKAPKYTSIQYDPPTIIQTLADYVATLRLEKALSRYPFPVQEEKGRQGGTLDSGYGSGQASRSIPNVYLGDPRHISHERRLRILLGLKITVPILYRKPATETSLKHTGESIMARNHQLAGHEGEKGARLDRSKAASSTNQEEKMKEDKVIGTNTEVSQLKAASQETAMLSDDIDESMIGRAVTVNERTVLRDISLPAQKQSQDAKNERGQMVDHYTLGTFSWELPEADYVYDLQQQEKRAPQLTLRDWNEYMMSGARREEKEVLAYCLRSNIWSEDTAKVKTF
ncbi:hypothetical protein E8E14_009965 [Neopestalotiopsis sp. 37M]|nr:hypothetical protein E8E14_009965 [Neopestalotiopsis sp. 37M]